MVFGLNLVTFKDSSNGCQLDNRRSVTGAAHFLGKAVIKTYSKRQNTVETSTYGSELVAARLAVEQQIGLRYKLRTTPSIHGIHCSAVKKRVRYTLSLER